MSLATQIQALATRVGAEIKTLREVDIPAVETLVDELPKDYDLVLHGQVFS
jgi:hypothetical protein